MLYPLKFKPIFKQRIWGGDTFARSGLKLPKNTDPHTVGECWTVSGVEGDLSVVAAGFLKSNNIQELIEVYMGDLVGEAVYETYGLEFPVLVKIIDARQLLSVQVHPDDDLAQARHDCRGKTEMWYVIDCQPDSFLYAGFNRDVTREEYLLAQQNGSLTDLLQKHNVRKGDAFIIPAGTVHALGPGLLIAEIQETSDITYRISDWNRVDADGKPRQLHTAEALDAIAFGDRRQLKLSTDTAPDSARQIVSTPFFTTSILRCASRIHRDYALTDSFVIYVCTEGKLEISTEIGTATVAQFESILLPAEADEATITGSGTLLEIHM